MARLGRLQPTSLSGRARETLWAKSPPSPAMHGTARTVALGAISYRDRLRRGQGASTACSWALDERGCQPARLLQHPGTSAQIPKSEGYFPQDLTIKLRRNCSPASTAKKAVLGRVGDEARQKGKPSSRCLTRLSAGKFFVLIYGRLAPHHMDQ